MISGVEVTVLRPGAATVDRLGNSVPGAPTSEDVGDVLVSEPTTEDIEAARPLGVSIAYTLLFPRSYSSVLEGCEVILPEPYGGTYRVIGRPTPTMCIGTPWNYKVDVEAAHG